MFFSKKTQNNAVMPQSATVVIVLLNDYQGWPAQWVRSSFVASLIVWRLFGDGQTSKSQQTYRLYLAYDSVYDTPFQEWL